MRVYALGNSAVLISPSSLWLFAVATGNYHQHQYYRHDFIASYWK